MKNKKSLLLPIYLIFPTLALQSSTSNKDQLEKESLVVQESLKEELAKDVIDNVIDGELRELLQGLKEGKKSENGELWLLKAIEEPQNQLAIIHYLKEKEIIKKPSYWFAQTEENSIPPLYQAAALGLIDVVAYLLKIGYRYDPNIMMMLAIENEHVDLVSFLFQKKIFSKRNLYTKKSWLDSSPASKEIIDLLLILSGLCLPLLSEYCVRHYLPHYIIYTHIIMPTSVVISGLLVCFIMILVNEAKVENDRKNIGYLHVAASCPSITESDTKEQKKKKQETYIRIAKILIKNGAEINSPGVYYHRFQLTRIRKSYNFTPLHYAIKRKCLLMAKWLIDEGANTKAIEKVKELMVDDSKTNYEQGEVHVYVSPLGHPKERIVGIYTPLDYLKQSDHKGALELYKYIKKKNRREKKKKPPKRIFKWLSL